MNKSKLSVLVSIIILPMIYILYNVYNLYSESGLISPCDLMLNLQYSVLFIFFEILSLYIFFNKDILLMEFHKYKDFMITFFAVFIIKIMKFSFMSINIDMVYLLKILVSTLSEFIIIIPFIFLLKYRFSKYFYKFLLLFILFINTTSCYYFYNTSELLNPIIFDNVNIISIKAIFDTFKLSDYIFLILSFILFLYILVVKNKHTEKKTLSIINYVKAILVVVFTYIILFYAQQGILSKTCSLYGYEKESKNVIVNIAMKNTLLDLIRSYAEYINKGNEKKINKNIYKKYTKEEKSFLLDRGLINKQVKNDFDILKYNKVIFITFESYSSDFINFYNKNIPEVASYYMDSLLKKYPHLNNFYSAGMPTQKGLNSLMRSKVTLNNIDNNSKTLFSFFNENGYYSSYLRGISKYYGEDQQNAKNYFRATNIIAKEELESKYGSGISSNWGVHNDTVYKEIINNMKKHNKLFLFVKTIDFHHPGVYYGDIKYPDSIKNDKVYKSLYWINKSLESFFEKLKEDNLFDDKTIIFITPDHNPHSSFGLDKYMINHNAKGLRRIPFIIVTKKPLESLRGIQDRYCSQVDFLPTFITSGNSFIGKNIKTSKQNFYITFYEDIFTYKNENKKLNFSLDVTKCPDYSKEDETKSNDLSIQDKSVCKLLYNTNNI